jgi:hypothetical protein
LIGFLPPFRFAAPIWNEAPLQKINRALTGLVVLASDLEFLRWRAVPSSRIVGQPAVTDVEPIDDGVVDRASGLDDSPTH